MALSDKYYEYDNRFKEHAKDFKAGPVEQRSVQDICCIVTFAIIFLFTIGAGIYFIIQGTDTFAKMTINQNAALSLAMILARVAPVFVGMCVLSAAMSVIYVFLAKTFPKCVVYTMIVLTFILYIALIIVGVVLAIYALAIVFGVILLITALILWCYWGYIQIGIALLGVAGTFLTQKPAVYFISILCCVLNALYTLFWVFSYIGVSSTGIVDDSQAFTILSYVWIADGVFFGYFLYYILVFLVAMACAFWYYQNPENSVMRGFNYIKFHLGSIAFAAVVITIITIMRMIANNQRKGGGGIGAICACIVACILSCIQELVKVLNHNSVIVMAITGEGYVDAAKSTIGVIFDNFGLFVIVDFFSQFIEVYATIFAVIIPAVIGAVIVYFTAQIPEYAVTDMIWVFILIILLGTLISSVILGMLSEVLSCVFIFYCFDCKFRALGMEVKNIPPQMKDIFDQANQSEDAEQASLNKLN